MRMATEREGTVGDGCESQPDELCFLKVPSVTSYFVFMFRNYFIANKYSTHALLANLRPWGIKSQSVFVELRIWFNEYCEGSEIWIPEQRRENILRLSLR